MSDVPTSDQITDLRTDFGDSGTPPMFSVAEIQRLWYRVRAADSEALQHEATLALMARSAMTNAARLRDHRTGNTEEKASQVFEHLKAIYAMYKKALDTVLGMNSEVALGTVIGVTDGEIPSEEAGGIAAGFRRGTGNDAEFV